MLLTIDPRENEIGRFTIELLSVFTAAQYVLSENVITTNNTNRKSTNVYFL